MENASSHELPITVYCTACHHYVFRNLWKIQCFYLCHNLPSGRFSRSVAKALAYFRRPAFIITKVRLGLVVGYIWSADIAQKCCGASGRTCAAAIDIYRPAPRSRSAHLAQPAPHFLKKLTWGEVYPPLHSGTYKRPVNKSKAILFEFIYRTLVGARMQGGVNFTPDRFLQICRNAPEAGGLARSRGPSPSPPVLSAAPRIEARPRNAGLLSFPPANTSYGKRHRKQNNSCKGWSATLQSTRATLVMD